MPLSPNEHRRLLGALWVALQFLVLAALAWLAAPAVLAGSPGQTCGWLLALSAALGGWTLLHNRFGNFNVHPQPKAGGVLVTSGPYRWMRHPMYTTVLLGAAGLACAASAWLGAGLWLALFGVLYAKARMEESWLREHHPPYAAYCQRCKRFVPGVF